MEMKVEPKTAADLDAILGALRAMAAADPSFVVAVDPESREIILKGQGELHLDMKVDELRRLHALECNVGPLQIAYRETVVGIAEVRATYRDGRRGEVATVALRVGPTELDMSNVFESDLEDDPEWDWFVGGVQAGVQAVWDQGVLIGFPLVNLEVKLLDFAFFDDSRADDFKIAARMAMKEACEKAGVGVLEPVMALEVCVPPDSIAFLLELLAEKRGEIFDMQMSGGDTVVGAFVPLSCLLGISADLARISAGQARHRITFERYQPVPPKSVGPEGGPENFPPAIGMRA